MRESIPDPRHARLRSRATGAGEARTKAASAIKKHCLAAGVAPYFIPAGGMMFTPPYDVDVVMIKEMGEKLLVAINNVSQELGWCKTAVGS